MVWEILHKATNVAMLSFVVSSMLAMGTGLTVGEIVAALRNHRLIMVALPANFVFNATRRAHLGESPLAR